MRRGLALATTALALATLAATPAAAQPAPAAPPAQAALTIPAGATRTGGLAVLAGDVEVRGQVRGDVSAVFGNVTVHPGGRVTGDVRSLFGAARAAPNTVSGTVSGGWRDREPPALRPPATAASSLAITAAWFGGILVLGLGLLAGASPQLDAVSGVLERSPGRSLLAGVVGELALAPALVVLVAALAVTVVGVLAVPLAVVLFVLAAAGLLTLGFLTSAFVVGRWATGARPPASAPAGRPRAGAARGVALRALAAGVAFFFALWAVAALLAGVPLAALLVRASAVAVTWVAVTAGFGAALLARGGRREARAAAPAAAAAGGVPVWQTPTPVSGVAAARRPVAVPSATSGARGG